MFYLSRLFVVSLIFSVSVQAATLELSGELVGNFKNVAADVMFVTEPEEGGYYSQACGAHGYPYNPQLNMDKYHWNNIDDDRYRLDLDLKICFEALRECNWTVGFINIYIETPDGRQTLTLRQDAVKYPKSLKDAPEIVCQRSENANDQLVFDCQYENMPDDQWPLSFHVDIQDQRHEIKLVNRGRIFNSIKGEPLKVIEAPDGTVIQLFPNKNGRLGANSPFLVSGKSVREVPFPLGRGDFEEGYRGSNHLTNYLDLHGSRYRVNLVYDIDESRQEWLLQWRRCDVVDGERRGFDTAALIDKFNPDSQRFEHQYGYCFDDAR